MFIAAILKNASLVTLCGLLLSCTTNASLSRDTFVRISNQSGVVLKSVHLGRRIIKQDSYSNTNFISEFGELSEGEVTGYRPLRESHYGLERFLVASGRGGYTRMARFLPVDGKDLQEALKHSYGVEFLAKHPYTRKDVTGYVLPPGNYTFTVTHDESSAQLDTCRPRPVWAPCKRGFVLEIQRDDAVR